MATLFDTTSESAPRFAIPAWLLSLLLHVGVLLTVALAPTLRTPPASLPTPERTAAIVLVDTRATSLSERYLTESDGETATSALNPSSAAAENHAAAPAATGAAGVAATELQQLLPPLAAASGTSAPVEVGSSLAESTGRGKALAPSSAGVAEMIASEQERLRPKLPSGPTAKVSVFGSPAAEGRSFVFVLDRSASTGSDGLGVLDTARSQLAKAVENLGPTHRFQVICYNQRPHYLGPKQMTLATTENKRLVDKFFQTLSPYGQTDHELALMAAVSAQPDVVFLMTDGGDPGLNPAQLRRIVDEGRKSTIHCIQFGAGPPWADGEKFMKRLAAETGGSYTYVDVNK